MIAALTVVPAAAQLTVPSVGLPRIGGVTDRIDATLDSAAEIAQHTAGNLVHIRDEKIATLLRKHSEHIEPDADGNPARRGELLLLNAGPAGLDLVRQQDFTIVSRETIDGLDIEVVRLTVPPGNTLAQAERSLRAMLPEATISADTLYFQAGGSVGSMRAGDLPSDDRPPADAKLAAPIGVIDGAPGTRTKIAAMRGFAEGAPYPSNHGSAIVSLLAYAGARNVRVADVYGTDIAGGSALAIARALGWLTQDGAKVVAISLVGPRNALLEKAVISAQSRNVIIVAAVGNDGPAAPPAYPASYRGVIAVTGVDGRNHALIEAGKALHLDYAAPGADLRARNAKGKSVKVRGTSFAVPLVAARAAIHGGDKSRIIAGLDGEAIDLGKKGPDDTYGRGLICGRCRP
jgi:hypothetical protein